MCKSGSPSPPFILLETREVLFFLGVGVVGLGEGLFAVQSLIPVNSDSSPHVHAHTTKTYQASRFNNQESSNSKTKNFANSNKQDLPQDIKSIKGDC
nr:hypothetical protein [Tanacetum cinerariifolium]